jgi:hypothetical protein
MTDMNPDFQYGQPQQPPQPQPVPTTPLYGQPQPLYQQQPGVPVQPQPTYAPPASNFIAPPKPSKKWLILAIVFIATTIIGLGLGGWALYNYLDQKNNVDAKVSTAVTDAVKEKGDKDAAAFLEKEKQPNRQFAGPDDYGRLAFDYPKTWSIYVDQDTSSGDTYKAYFNPVSVPPVKETTQYALRVTIEQKDIEKVIAGYDNLVKKGDLKVSAVKVDGSDGTRLDGSFTKDIRGAAVVFKIRDKTVTIRTDAETFIRNKTALDGTNAPAVPGDFDALVSTITFNK